MSKLKQNHPLSRRVKTFNKKDAIYESWFVQKLIKALPLKDPARSKKLVRSVLADFKKVYRIPPDLAVLYAIQSIRPLLWVRIRRRGKKQFRIPFRLRPIRQYKKGFKWFIKEFSTRSERCAKKRLLLSIVEIFENKSKILLWRRKLISDAIRNRHNASYKWK